MGLSLNEACPGSDVVLGGRYGDLFFPPESRPAFRGFLGLSQVIVFHFRYCWTVSWSDGFIIQTKGR